MEEEAKSIKADKAMYIRFESAFASLDPSCRVGLRSVVDIKNHLQSKESTSKQTKTGENDVFMGIIDRTLELNKTTNSFRLDLMEISSSGDVGEPFFLTLYRDITKAWLNNAVIKLYASKSLGITLVVFKGNGIIVSLKGGNIHFDLTSAVKCKAIIWTKQYFASAVEAKADNYVYTDLSKASKEVNKYYNMFVVVQDVLKAASRTAKGTYHGMVSVVDSTCYDENLQKTSDYALHLFIPNLENFPSKLKRGDILRVHRCKAETKPNVDKVDFYIFREHDLLIFPAGDHLNPLTKSQRYTITAQELEDVKRLNIWSFSRYQERAMPLPSPPPAEPSAEPPLRTIEEIKAREDFSLPCRLVKACQSSKEWSLWVEDGTKCKLVTSNCDDELEAYDSQKTLTVGDSNTVIQVRAPLKMIEDLLTHNRKALENGTLLFLRNVKAVPGFYPDVDSTNTVAVFFDVVGDVEVLPKNTRYYNGLTKRLNGSSKKQAPVAVALQVLSVEPGPSTEEPVRRQTPNVLPQPTQIPPVTSLKKKTSESVENLDGDVEAVVCGLPQSVNHVEEIETIKTTLKSVVSLASSTTSSKQVASSSSSTSSKRMTRFQSEPLSQKTRFPEQPLLSTPEKRHDKPSPKFQTPKEHQSPPKVRASSQKFTITRYDTVSSQSSSEDIIVQHSPSVDYPIEPTPDIIDDLSDASNRTSSSKKTKHNSGNGDEVISSSMESTEKAMVEIPSCVFHDTEWVQKTPYKTVMKDVKVELRRMHLYAHPEADLSTEEESEDSETEGPHQVRSMESQDISFAEPIVTSTQKPRETQIVSETIEEVEESQPYPEAQPILFSSPEVVKKDTSCSSNGSDFERSLSSSPHPNFRAIEEVLEIRTNCSQSTAGDDFRSIPNDSPLVHSQSAQDDLLVNEEMVVESSVVRRIQHGENKMSRIKSPQQQRVAEVTKRKAESPVAPSNSKKKKLRHSSSSDSSITEVMSDSDESVIELVPSSQLDLEHQYRLVEESITIPDPFVLTMTEVEAIQPGGRFRISTAIRIMTSANKQTSRQMDLENLLVATCFECNHIWQYHHFKNSISERVKRQRRLSSTDDVYEDDETQGGAYNYLCSEEIHACNMNKLVETGDSKGLEYDVFDCFIDRSFVFVCPECKSFKKPDCLIQLMPSFFFRLHAISLQDEAKCLHILATGVHAEYFLGTRADYVLRSAKVWERCQQRLNQLMSCDKPLTLSLRRSADQPKEIYLENTKVIFSDTHVLPWWD